MRSVGAFGPWARASPGRQYQWARGRWSDRSRHWRAAFVALWGYANGKRASAIGACLGGAVAIAIGIYDAYTISEDASADLFGERVQVATVGWGLYLTIAAAGSLALTALVLFFSPPASHGQTAPGAPPPPPPTPAGWYPNQHGPGMRWWDGSRWTDHLAPDQPPAQQGPEAPSS